MNTGREEIEDEEDGEEKMFRFFSEQSEDHFVSLQLWCLLFSLNLNHLWYKLQTIVWTQYTVKYGFDIFVLQGKHFRL